MCFLLEEAILNSIYFSTSIIMFVGGRKLVAIINPHIKAQEGYYVYDQAKEGGYFVKSKDNSTDFIAECWPGNSSYIDFLNKNASDWYANLYDLENFNGSTNNLYIWNDMNEPSVFKATENTMPDDLLHNGGQYMHREVHNIYGFTQVQATYQGLLDRAQFLRPFVLTRSFFAGSQRYAAIWTGDNVATWEHLRISVPMCLTTALAGISFCGADIGGFVNDVEEELLQRWYQAAAWLPFFRGHSNKDVKRREPYLYSEVIQNRIRNAIKQRYVHLPYWYTLFYEHSLTGIPVIRPLVYHYENDAKTFDIDNQWLIGRDILASPVLHKVAKEITVYFPGKNEHWYDITQNKKYRNGHFRIPVNLDTVPIYYRGGSIISRKDTSRGSSVQTYNDPITLYLFLDADQKAEGNLFIDDYASFNYTENKYLYVKFTYREYVLEWRKIGDADYDTDVSIKEVVIYGPPVNIKVALIDANMTCKPLKMSYGPNNVFLYIYDLTAPIRDVGKLKFIAA